jgi:hypothetical protein
MKRPVSLILAIILLVTCSGCFWGHARGGYGDRDRGGYGDQDRGGYGDRDRGGHDDGDRHDDRRDLDDHR